MRARALGLPLAPTTHSSSPLIFNSLGLLSLLSKWLSNSSLSCILPDKLPKRLYEPFVWLLLAPVYIILCYQSILLKRAWNHWHVSPFNLHAHSHLAYKVWLLALTSQLYFLLSPKFLSKVMYFPVHSASLGLSLSYSLSWKVLPSFFLLDFQILCFAPVKLWLTMQYFLVLCPWTAHTFFCALLATRLHLSYSVDYTLLYFNVH